MGALVAHLEEASMLQELQRSRSLEQEAGIFTRR